MSNRPAKSNVFKSGASNNTALALIAANVAIFLLVAFINRLFSPTIADDLFDVLALSCDSLHQHPWSILTYMFTQVNLFHLVINMAWLYVFGNILGLFTSRLTTIVLYLGGGFLAACVFIIGEYIFPSNAGLRLTGASSAVLSIVGALIIIAPNYNVRIIGNCKIRLKWIGWTAALSLMLFVNSSQTYIALIHISGLLFGLISGYLSKRKLSVPIEGMD